MDNAEALLDILTIQSMRERFQTATTTTNNNNNHATAYDTDSSCTTTTTLHDIISNHLSVDEDDLEKFVRDFSIDDSISDCFAGNGSDPEPSQIALLSSSSSSCPGKHGVSSKVTPDRNRKIKGNRPSAFIDISPTLNHKEIKSTKPGNYKAHIDIYTREGRKKKEKLSSTIISDIDSDISSVDAEPDLIRRAENKVETPYAKPRTKKIGSFDQNIVHIDKPKIVDEKSKLEEGIDAKNIRGNCPNNFDVKKHHLKESILAKSDQNHITQRVQKKTDNVKSFEDSLLNSNKVNSSEMSKGVSKFSLKWMLDKTSTFKKNSHRSNCFNRQDQDRSSSDPENGRDDVVSDIEFIEVDDQQNHWLASSEARSDNKIVNDKNSNKYFCHRGNVSSSSSSSIQSSTNNDPPLMALPTEKKKDDHSQLKVTNASNENRPENHNDHNLDMRREQFPYISVNNPDSQQRVCNKDTSMNKGQNNQIFHNVSELSKSRKLVESHFKAEQYQPPCAISSQKAVWEIGIDFHENFASLNTTKKPYLQHDEPFQQSTTAHSSSDSSLYEIQINNVNYNHKVNDNGNHNYPSCQENESSTFGNIKSSMISQDDAKGPKVDVAACSRMRDVETSIVGYILSDNVEALRRVLICDPINQHVRESLGKPEWKAEFFRVAIQNNKPACLQTLLETLPPASESLLLTDEIIQEFASMCVRQRQVRCLRVLLQHFGTSHLKSFADEQGNTLLHLAATQNDPELVLLLLALGMDVNARNSPGKTPLLFCQAQMTSDGKEKSAVDVDEGCGEGDWGPGNTVEQVLLMCTVIEQLYKCLQELWAEKERVAGEPSHISDDKDYKYSDIMSAASKSLKTASLNDLDGKTWIFPLLSKGSVLTQHHHQQQQQQQQQQSRQLHHEQQQHRKEHYHQYLHHQPHQQPHQHQNVEQQPYCIHHQQLHPLQSQPEHPKEQHHSFSNNYQDHDHHHLHYDQHYQHQQLQSPLPLPPLSSSSFQPPISDTRTPTAFRPVIKDAVIIPTTKSVSGPDNTRNNIKNDDSNNSTINNITKNSNNSVTSNDNNSSPALHSIISAPETTTTSENDHLYDVICTVPSPNFCIPADVLYHGNGHTLYLSPPGNPGDKRVEKMMDKSYSHSTNAVTPSNPLDGGRSNGECVSNGSDAHHPMNTTSLSNSMDCYTDNSKNNVDGSLSGSSGSSTTKKSTNSINNNNSDNNSAVFTTGASTTTWGTESECHSAHNSCEDRHRWGTTHHQCSQDNHSPKQSVLYQSSHKTNPQYQTSFHAIKHNNSIISPEGKKHTYGHRNEVQSNSSHSHKRKLRKKRSLSRKRGDVIESSSKHSSRKEGENNPGLDHGTLETEDSCSTLTSVTNDILTTTDTMVSGLQGVSGKALSSSNSRDLSSFYTSSSTTLSNSSQKFQKEKQKQQQQKCDRCRDGDYAQRRPNQNGRNGSRSRSLSRRRASRDRDFGRGKRSKSCGYHVSNNYCRECHYHHEDDDDDDDDDDEYEREAVKLDLGNENLPDEILRVQRLERHLQAVHNLHHPKPDVLETVITGTGERLVSHDPMPDVSRHHINIGVAYPFSENDKSQNPPETSTTSTQKTKSKALKFKTRSRLFNHERASGFTPTIKPREMTESEFEETYDRRNDPTVRYRQEMDRDVQWDDVSFTTESEDTDFTDTDPVG